MRAVSITQTCLLIVTLAMVTACADKRGFRAHKTTQEDILTMKKKMGVVDPKTPPGSDRSHLRDGQALDTGGGPIPAPASAASPGTPAAGAPPPATRSAVPPRPENFAAFVPSANDKGGTDQAPPSGSKPGPTPATPATPPAAAAPDANPADAKEAARLQEVQKKMAKIEELDKNPDSAKRLLGLTAFLKGHDEEKGEAQLTIDMVISSEDDDQEQIFGQAKIAKTNQFEKLSFVSIPMKRPAESGKPEDASEVTEIEVVASCDSATCDKIIILVFYQPDESDEESQYGIIAGYQAEPGRAIEDPTTKEKKVPLTLAKGKIASVAEALKAKTQAAAAPAAGAANAAAPATPAASAPAAKPVTPPPAASSAASSAASPASTSVASAPAAPAAAATPAATAPAAAPEKTEGCNTDAECAEQIRTKLLNSPALAAPPAATPSAPTAAAPPSPGLPYWASPIAWWNSLSSTLGNGVNRVGQYFKETHCPNEQNGGKGWILYRLRGESFCKEK